MVFHVAFLLILIALFKFPHGQPIHNIHEDLGLGHYVSSSSVFMTICVANKEILVYCVNMRKCCVV